MRGSVDLNALSLDCGTSLRTVDEGRIYDIEYQRGAVELAMRFTARESPIITDNEGTAAFFAGHLDQAGHYGGTLRLEGRDYAIDCHGIRDRSWGPRVIGDDIRLGYCHGQSPEFAFLAYARPAPDAAPGADEDVVFKGYLQRGDRRLALTGGSRRLHRRGGRLVGIDVEMVTATGETVSGRGTVLNRFAYMPYPNLLTWLYLVRWEFAGGLVVYGEEQDAWSLPLWRAHLNAGGWSGQ